MIFKRLYFITLRYGWMRHVLYLSATLFDKALWRLHIRAGRHEYADCRQSHFAYNKSMEITLIEIEQAINYWRALRPSIGEQHALSPEVDALATVYALMIFKRVKSVPVEALDQTAVSLVDAWRKQQRYNNE
jgi:hypothetical protein